jgi:hypothetical protein
MPFDTMARTTPGLADVAYTRLVDRFSTFGHRPSDTQWAAIRDLLDHLQAAASGDLGRAVYLSAIPAGTGKSQSIAAFASSLLDDADHGSVGMLITVNRRTEAADMADQLSAFRNRLCVITADGTINAKGGHDVADEAQVCICTQAALKRTTKTLAEASFDAAARFHYRGARRAIVCWDEAFAFNRPVVLDADTVSGLARAMRAQSVEAATILKRWSADVDELTGLCTVPDFETLGVDFQRLEEAVGDRDELVAQVKALAVISGDAGFISRQGNASAVITHFPEIPHSLMPVIVTDASARVNASYAQMAQKVPIRWLKDAPKTYRNFTIRIVNTAASRSVYRDTRTPRGRNLLDMAARYIASVPNTEEVLVIGYKGRFGMKGVVENDLEQALRSRLRPEDRGRLRWLTWGRHTATNNHKHVRHVLLLGLNFVPRAAGHATSGAALNLDLRAHHPTEDQIKAVQDGMLMDATLQALLRGNARIGVDGDCGVMEAVIPQTRQTGLSYRQYRTMFPEVNVVADTVLLPPVPLKGRLKDLAEIVFRRLEAGETVLTNPSLYDELGMQRPNFAALIKKPEWQAYVAQLGLVPQRLKGNVMGLRMVP